MRASAVSSVVAEGKSAGCRAIDLRVERGIDLRLLPDRGLDAGDAWFGGVPLDWRSPVGETAPVANDWLRSFGGGLVTTCGLLNVGAPSEGHGLHGDFTFQRARVEAVERAGDTLGFAGPSRRPRRSPTTSRSRRVWRTHAGEGRVELEDVVLEPRPRDEPALRSTTSTSARRCGRRAPSCAGRARDAARATRTPRRSRTRGRPRPGIVEGAHERVFEHEVAPGADGWCSATVRHPGVGLELEVRWDAATMPRMWQWVHPAPGLGVLGIEPANCSVLGVAHDRAEGRLPGARARRGAPYPAGDPRPVELSSPARRR